MGNQHTTGQGQPQRFVLVERPQSNKSGLAGLVLSIVAIFTGWIPFLGWFIWFLGVVFSFIGLLSRPRRYAIAGLIISFIGVIFLLFVFGAILGIAALVS